MLFRSKVTKWQAKLGKRTKPRIGIVWRGNPEHRNDHNRSLNLSQIIPYLPSNLEYISLQKEILNIDQETFHTQSTIKQFDEPLNDFTDTAALCELMDLVITVDTSVAHLAGSQGKKTWVLLPYSPDWRWLLDREDSPWYPSIKLFRQNEIGDWSSVLEKINIALQVFKV